MLYLKPLPEPDARQRGRGRLALSLYAVFERKRRMTESSLNSDRVEEGCISQEGEKEAVFVQADSHGGKYTSGEAPVSHMASHRSWIFNPLLMLASMAGGLSNVCIKQLLLPIQVAQIDPQHTATSFAIVASSGALIGMIAAPFSGALSDRTTWRWGRRRSWMFLGILVAVIGMLIMARSTTLVTLLLGEMLAQIGIDSILATVTAIIPDRVPREQQAIASALVGMAPNVGGVVGLVLVTTLTDTRIIAQGYDLMAGASLVCVMIFVLVFREPPFPREASAPFHIGRFLISFLRPLFIQDFLLTLLSRTLVFLSFTILGAFLFYDLHDNLHLAVPIAAQKVTLFQVLSTLLLFVMALLTGVWAQKAQRLKPFLIGGALLMALGLLLLAWLPGWSIFLLAAGIFGVGYGAYLGVDINLAVRILPSAEERGKDLGLLYTATFLSLILSPLIGAVVLSLSRSYGMLFTIAALASLLAAAFILPIRSVQ
jgi:MFS family permease